MKIVHHIFTGCLMVALSGCGMFSDDNRVEPAALVDFEEEVELDVIWSRRVGDQGEPDLYLRLVPAYEADKIYTASHDGVVRAIDRLDGDSHWKVALEDVELISAVGAGGGLVLVGSSEGVLIALDQQNGEEKWRAVLSSEMLAAAQSDGDVVVVQTMDGKAAGLDAKNGQKLWSYSTSVPALSLRTSGTPVIESGVVYLVFASGEMLALNARTGLLLWKQYVSLPKGRNELERLISFDGQPLVLGTSLYTGAYQGNVVAVDRTRGRVQWQEPMSVSGRLSAANGNLYLTTDRDGVMALKMAGGRSLWENRSMSHRRLTAPVVVGNYLAVGDAEGYLHLLSQEDGSFVGRKKIGGDGFRNPLQSDGETLYALTSSGKLLACRLTDP